MNTPQRYTKYLHATNKLLKSLAPNIQIAPPFRICNAEVMGVSICDAFHTGHDARCKAEERET